MSGTLHVIATPLGHLDDLSPRARETLARCALVACEDTRRTAKLLAHCGLALPMIALHKFNEAEAGKRALAVLRGGGDVALVSDGGTPAISDPGAFLVRSAHEEGVPVSPVPGPSAVTALLSASGLPADRFVFEGFLPPRAGERRKRLRALATEARTIVVYEAPHRILACLTDLDAVLGDRTLVVGRELTKLHETILRGSARQILARFGDQEVRGELAIAIAGCDPSAPQADAHDPVADAWREALVRARGDTHAALKEVAAALSIKKPEARRRLAELGLIRD